VEGVSTCGAAFGLTHQSECMTRHQVGLHCYQQLSKQYNTNAAPVQTQTDVPLATNAVADEM